MHTICFSLNTAILREVPTNKYNNGTLIMCHYYIPLSGVSLRMAKLRPKHVGGTS